MMNETTTGTFLGNEEEEWLITAPSGKQTRVRTNESFSFAEQGQNKPCPQCKHPHAESRGARVAGAKVLQLLQCTKCNHEWWVTVRLNPKAR